MISSDANIFVHKTILLMLFVGGAGVSAAFVYAGLTSIGVSPRLSILLMLVVPVLMAFGYDTILVSLVMHMLFTSTFDVIFSQTQGKLLTGFLVQVYELLEKCWNLKCHFMDT